MNPGLAKRLLSEIAGLGLAGEVVFHVLGEPSLYPECTEMLGFAHRVGLRTILVTNGMLLGEDFGTQVVDCPPDELCVSVQTPDLASYAFRRAPLAFDEYRQGILGFIAKVYPRWPHTQFILRFLATDWLEKAWGLGPLYSKACSDPATRTQVVGAWAREVREATGMEEAYAGPALGCGLTRLEACVQATILDRIRFDVMQMLEWVDWSLFVHGPRVRTGGCTHHKDHIAVLWNGDVVLCCLDANGHTAVGNVGNALLADVLGGTRARHALAEFDQGRAAFPFCRGCLGRWHQTIERLFAGNRPGAAGFAQ